MATTLNQPEVLCSKMSMLSAETELFSAGQFDQSSIDAALEPETLKRIPVFCVRHGETPYNVSKLVTGQHDPALTPKGVAQAIAIDLAEVDNTSLFLTSDLQRSSQTAALVLKNQNIDVPLYFDARLREVGLGDLEGTRRTFIRDYSENNVDFSPPNGESYRSASKRVLSFFHDLILVSRRYQPKSIVIFTHGGTLRIINSFLLNNFKKSDLFSFNFGNADVTKYSLSDFSVPDFWMDN